MRAGVVYCVIVLCASMPVHAAPAPTAVNVAVGKMTQVDFPEAVAKVVKGGPPDAVLVEVAESSVFLVPQSMPPADITIIGTSGTSYPLRLVEAKDPDVRVVVAPESISQSKSQRRERGGALDMMKDLLLGRVPEGAAVHKQDKSMTLAQGNVVLVMDAVYELPHLTGYVFKASNQTDMVVVIPLQHITFPYLLAISSEADTLTPRGSAGDSARIYVIVGKS